MMDKIAMLETAVLAMNRKIEHLQADRKTEDHEIELLQLKLNEVERHSSVEMIDEEYEDNDVMDLQLDAEMTHLRSSIDRLSRAPVVHQSMKDEALNNLAQVSTKIAAHKKTLTGNQQDDENVELDSSNFAIMDVNQDDEAEELPCDGEEDSKKAEEKAA